MPQIPRSLPISKRKGSERLGRLERRLRHLQTIIIPTGRSGVEYDRAESSALDWAIKSLIIYERVLVEAFQGDTDRLEKAIVEGLHSIDSKATGRPQ